MKVNKKQNMYLTKKKKKQKRLLLINACHVSIMRLSALWMIVKCTVKLQHRL